MDDAILIGGGILSATVGAMLQQLEPTWSIRMLERLGSVAQEASNGWNNAGTGHAGLCETHYTAQRPDGCVDIDRAVGVAEQFAQSRTFWSRSDARAFMRTVPHMTLVQGEADVAFLRARHRALVSHPLFAAMEYTEDLATLHRWAPLVAEGRTGTWAATRDVTGCDIDFGALTRGLTSELETGGAVVETDREVTGLTRGDDGNWTVTVRVRPTGETLTHRARFVFVGAGGGALRLLQRAGVDEARGYGLLPISGQFLRCDAAHLVERHDAKVYGTPPIGAPPMSVPHLDTRIVDGRRSILFGPFAGSSPKFLRHGSRWDLPRSIDRDNIGSLLTMTRRNVPLVRLLLSELTATDRRRLAALRVFAPTSRIEDWTLVAAGQRAQIVREGQLQFGTEVVAAQDGTIASVLGASPGASTAVSIAAEVLTRCFPQRLWRKRLREMTSD